jgi:hypothetical protein
LAFDPAKYWQLLRESLSAPKVWGFVLLVSLPALLLPQSTAELLGIAGLRAQFRPWLGVAVFVSVAALLLNVGSAIWAWWQRRQRSAALRMELLDLSATEKQLLKGYLEQRTKTQYFTLTNGVATGLESRKILYRAANMGDMISGFAFNIQPWAWSELIEHPELLNLTPEEVQALEATNADQDGMPSPFNRLRRRI